MYLSDFILAKSGTLMSEFTVWFFDLFKIW